MYSKKKKRVFWTFFCLSLSCRLSLSLFCLGVLLLSILWYDFAHGANDVANSIAPFGAIWAIYESGEVSKKKNDLGDNPRCPSSFMTKHICFEF